MLETPKALNTTMVKTSMDNTMDNQQVREVVYFAGLMDGEGSYCLEKSETGNGKVRYTPRFSFGTTSQLQSDKFHAFLQKHDIAYYFQTRAYPEPYKLVYSFEIKRMLQCLKFCKLMLEDTVEKKANCQGLITFIESRLDADGDLAYRGQSKHGYSYAPWVDDLWMEMRIRNGRNKPKGTSKQLSNLHDQMFPCKIEYGLPEVMVSPASESCSA